MSEQRTRGLSALERAEHKRLSRLWAVGKATRRQMDRCMELDRRSEAAARSAA
jgi:hypothetical protein